MVKEKDSILSWKQKLLVGILIFVFVLSTCLFLLLSLMVSPIGFTVGSFVTPTPTATPRPTATVTPTFVPGETPTPTPTLERDPLLDAKQGVTGGGGDPLVVWTTLIIAGFTSIISLASLVTTTTLNWRREARETRAARLEAIKMRLELEKAKLELEKLRKESKTGK